MSANPSLGSVLNLTNGLGVFTLRGGTNFWFIQNQDIVPLFISFIDTTGKSLFSTLSLAPATARGAPGGYLDSIGFPYFQQQGFTLTSSILAAQFGSGQSLNLPNNSYPYPGSQPAP